MSRTDDTPVETFEFIDDVETDSDNRSDLYKTFDQYVAAPARVIWSDWRGKLSIVLIAFYVFMGTVGVVLVPTPESDVALSYLSPFQMLEHPLGTDLQGRGILRLLVHSTPAMLKMVAAGALFTTIVATIVGTVSGYKGGRVDSVLMTFTDIAMTIPGLPLVVVLSAIFQPESPALVGIILAINAWAGLARALRSEILTLRDESYVEASRAMGISPRTIIEWNILPNVMPYIMIRFANAVRNIMFSSVALYFIGILPTRNLNWGIMLNEAYNQGAMYSFGRMHTIVIPFIAITAFIYAFVLFAQASDSVFNPRIRVKSEKTASESESEL
ncbi:ABC transporter permease [Halovenus marina]|uniref:ABC transporter permease n=1 Tax=Halovenus marina TaxID=3396621 RepID=UPI003F54E933